MGADRLCLARRGKFQPKLRMTNGTARSSVFMGLVKCGPWEAAVFTFFDYFLLAH
jgi:hypothetical protein